MAKLTYFFAHFRASPAEWLREVDMIREPFTSSIAIETCYSGDVVALIGLLVWLRLGGDKLTSGTLGAIGAMIMTMAVVGLIGWAWWTRTITHVGWIIWLLFAAALVFAAMQTVVNRRRMAKEL